LIVFFAIFPPPAIIFSKQEQPQGGDGCQKRTSGLERESQLGLPGPQHAGEYSFPALEPVPAFRATTECGALWADINLHVAPHKGEGRQFIHTAI
jgi:hypothetical protein